MLALAVSFALAQSPLQVIVRPLALPDGGSVAAWAPTAEIGGLSVGSGSTATATKVSWLAGTKGSLCSPPVAVPAGSTVRLRTRTTGSAGLGDVTALHLHLAGATGEHHIARRRFDVGAFPWEPVEVTATLPTGTESAYACLEVQMVKPDSAGSLELEPVVLESIRAESRSHRLPIRRILLVSIETIRWDHVSGNGYGRATTPNLDQLMREGVSLDQHYAPAPYTHPSLASLITGQAPVTLGFVDNIPSIGRSFPTAAELMSQAGYVTAAFNVQYVLSNRYGLNRGFHYYRNHPNDTSASVLNQELIPFLTEHADDNLFLWAHYFDPHGPYRPPASYRADFAGDAVWAGDTMLVARGEASEGAPAVPKYIFEAGKTERRHYVAGYDGDLAFADAELGRLMAYVRASNRDDTLVVVTGDHGESMTDHQRYFCHGSLYDHDLHVPMVVWGPGLVPAGGRIAVPTSHVDVLPTLLDYADVGGLPGFAGLNLRSALSGGAPPVREWVTSVVGRAERLRYAVHAPGGLKVLTDARGAFLQTFDVAKDPDERAALTDNKEGRALSRRFAAWLRSQAPKKVKRQTLDAEDAERLRALGYLD
ncbi:MAG: hypothetical protein EXR71_20430 [Myxococcales bacterium]|nr:hypothetical protein [Myxococcales bacterium]